MREPTDIEVRAERATAQREEWRQGDRVDAVLATRPHPAPMGRLSCGHERRIPRLTQVGDVTTCWRHEGGKFVDVEGVEFDVPADEPPAA